RSGRHRQVRRHRWPCRDLLPALPLLAPPPGASPRHEASFENFLVLCLFCHPACRLVLYGLRSVPTGTTRTPSLPGRGPADEQRTPGGVMAGLGRWLLRGAPGAALCALAAGVCAGTASAQTGPVSPVPATGTPALAPTGVTEQVRQLVECGGTMYAVG